MPTPDGFEGKSLDELEDSLATIQQQLNALTAEINKRKGVDNWNAANVPATSTDKMEYSGRLYMWGRERITQQDVLNVVNSIKEPYSSEISSYLKSNNIAWLQEYLNSKIDSWDIDASKLKAALTPKGIWLYANNHIKVDWKFWPQTLETIKFLVKESQNDPDAPWDWQPTRKIANGADWWNNNPANGWDVRENAEWGNNEPFSKEKFNAFIETTRPILMKLWLTYVSTWGWIITNNPEFDVMKYSNGRHVTKTFNFRDFVEGNTFLAEKLENTLKSEMDKAMQEDTIEREEYSNAYNFVGKIKGKKYSLKDLNLENNNQDADLLTLLNEFPDQKVRIDWHGGCTFYNANTKKFRIELNRKNFNSKDWCVREVSREEFKDSEWNYSEDVFKQKLAQRIQDIAKEYFSN